MHLPSKDTYEHIAKWLAPDFFYSLNQAWERFGILGVFGDMYLTNVHGDILEIGTGESSIYLTALSKKFNCRIFHCDIEDSKIINPMTVPGYLSDDVFYIDRSSIDKTGSGHRCVAYAGASNDFFKDVSFSPIALAFIDGGHTYEQAKQDFENIIKLLVDDGVVLLHDTYPPSEQYLSPDYACGDVYKLRLEIEKDERFDSFTFTKGIAMGVGLTVVRKKTKTRPYYQ